jgi:allophanate hydrolase
MGAPPSPTFAGWRTLPLRDALAHVMARIDRQGKDPAWICVATPQQIEVQLARIEAQPADSLPLRGLPFAVKDNVDVAGWPTTAACPAFAHTATYTARAVQKLMDAGAVLVGKTNLDQFATGLVGTRSPYGAVPNSFDPAYVSGGSSSGSASVVARGLVAFSLGTDTAGSGRVPAGFNNLVGVKPTPGRVSIHGVVPACRTLDTLSIFALLADDAAEVLAVAEHAPDEALQEPSFRRCTPGAAQFATLRVACPAAPEFVGDAAYAGAFDDAKAHLRGLASEVGAVDMTPFFDIARLLYDGPWVAERHTVLEKLMAEQPEAIDPTVRRVVSAATRFSATDAFRAEYKLRELEVLTHEVWQRYDMLMLPTAPTLPTLAEVAKEPVLRNSELGMYTNFVNLLGLSAIAVPAGFTPKGLPFGVTFVARNGMDAALLHWAAQWQASLRLPLGFRLGPFPEPTAVAATPRAPTRAPRAEPSLAVAVVGAHLQGMPLHGQLVERGARLLQRTRTAPRYRLHALPGQTPPKPGLARLAGGDVGHAIEVEVYDMPQQHLGSFLALIAPPLGLGSVELEDGRWVKGFICEPWALHSAPDVSAFGGWRGYMASLAKPT